ncbi:uncharacterized protein ELE39_000343 [Cryptosporidium sp. chipmunk genotype I]|uniref:uncharacterized protein n=1 Tax=Cryptosporidium sp. chipmunk genotype I TaxID=1280935 RepID=UPI00351A4685|nr:hypothetical protein ELE39_000343 [Cryptosporidium sp. chipmunk genotype I]
MGVYISDDNSRSNYNILPDCKFSLCYINLVLSSQKFIKRKEEFETKGFEYFISLNKKNLLSEEEAQIGSYQILPLNYCTPFERNYCTIYFNFFSINELTEFLEKNEIIAILKLSFGVNDFEVLFNEAINCFIKPITSIENELFLSNKNNDFELGFIINVEWYARIPKKMIKNFGKNVEEPEKNISISSSSQIPNKVPSITIGNNPNVYLIYEKTICNDPIISQNIMGLKSKWDMLSKKSIQKPPNIKSDFFTSKIQSLNKIGSWTVRIKDVILTEKGFIHLCDMFPKYRQSKSFRIFIQYCIKNKDGKPVTEIRKHWSIMSFFKQNSNYFMDNRIPSNPYYIAKANICSRIPETITDHIDKKFFYINFLSPTLQIFDEAMINKGNVIFHGVLYPSEISLTETSVVKLYSKLNKEECLGYALVSFSDIKEKLPTCLNSHFKSDRIVELKNNYSKKKQSIANYLEGMSIIYLYIYWHIQVRAKNENKTPESVLAELYSKISNSKTIKGGTNITGMNKCVDALMHSNTELAQSLKDYTACVPDDLILFNNVHELKYYLQFPHLEVFKNSFNDIFSNDNLEVLNESEFIYRCNELGIRECTSITWREMMRSFANISLKTCKSCLQVYRAENIFL